MKKKIKDLRRGDIFHSSFGIFCVFEILESKSGYNVLVSRNLKTYAFVSDEDGNKYVTLINQTTTNTEITKQN